jgi:hypothetical protein
MTKEELLQPSTTMEREACDNLKVYFIFCVKHGGNKEKGWRVYKIGLVT